MITGEKLSGLTESEVHNILLMEVHNRLAEISRFLEVITVKYADLDHIDRNTITADYKIDMFSLPNDFEENSKYVVKKNHYKLSNKKTSRPVDDNNYFLTDEEIENKWGKDVLMAIKKGYALSRKKTSE